MQGLDRFSDAVATLYDAAAAPERWPDALRAIEDLTGSADVSLIFAPLRADPALTISSRFSEDICNTYSTDYLGICRRVAYGATHPDVRLHYDALVATEREMDRDPVYSWLQSIGLRYFVAGNVHRNANYQVYASLQRSPTQGHVQRSEIELFQLVSRHIGQALMLADELGTLDAHRRFSTTALDLSPQALFALSERGRIVFANRAAERLMHDGAAIMVREGHLCAALPSEQRAFARLIASAAGSVEDGAGGWLRLRRAGTETPLAVFATRLPAAAILPTTEQACVLLAVHDPLARAATAGEALREVFGLTDAECRIAEGLASGLTPAALAAAANTSAQTVRSQIKAVFRKLDAHRQQDVTRIVLGLTGMTPHPPNGG